MKNFILCFALLFAYCVPQAAPNMESSRYDGQKHIAYWDNIDKNALNFIQVNYLKLALKTNVNWLQVLWAWAKENPWYALGIFFFIISFLSTAVGVIRALFFKKKNN